MNILRLISVLLLLLGFAASADATGGSGYWIANVGQWEGDFQFKCEVGSTIYYVTPQGMTVDFRSYVGADGNPPAASGFDNLAEWGFSEVLEKHAAVPRRNLEIKGHVIQIHYSRDPRRQVSSPAPPTKIAIGENKLPHYSNYFLGRDSTKWRSRVSHYQNIIVPEVWPGIDVEYRADKQGVETIYHVKPGADPTQIQMEYLGLDAPLRVDAQGNLILETSLGDVKEKAPFAFQQVTRTQLHVESSYRVVGDSRMVFELGGYDLAKELVVDPLIYSSYWGGNVPDDIYDMDVSHNGQIFIVGNTLGGTFPTTPGSYQDTLPEPNDQGGGFLSCLTPEADSLIFSTFLGPSPGGGETYLRKVACNDEGAAYLYGETNSETWPVTANALQTELWGSGDPFLSLVSSDGTTLEFSTLLGGPYFDDATSMSISQAGFVYLLGASTIGYPVTTDAIYSNPGPGQVGFVTVIDPLSWSIDYSTFIADGTVPSSQLIPWDMELIDPSSVWIAGWAQEYDELPTTPNAVQSEVFNDPPSLADGFLMKLNFESESVDYASYLGGSWQDRLFGIDQINDHQVAVCGASGSVDFPLTSGVFDTSNADSEGVGGFDGCVSVIDLEHGLLASTFLGGALHDDALYYVQAGQSGITAIGYSSSADFPVSEDADDSLLNAHGEPVLWALDLVIARLDTDLTTLQYGSFYGGDAGELPLGAFFQTEDTVWVVGSTGSQDYPVSEQAIQSTQSGLGDGFLTRIVLPQHPDFVSRHNRFSFMPETLYLSAYPNPFNPTTTLSFTLPHHTNVTLTIHNILGQQVEHIDFGKLSAGTHTQQIGNPDWPSGVYFATLKTPTTSHSTKLLLLR